MKLEKTLRKIVEQECTRGRYDSGIELTQIDDTKPYFKMYTKLEKGGETHIQYNPKYEEIHPGKTKIVVRDGARHEINHHGYRGFKGCPRNVDNHTKLIFEPISEVLIPKGFSGEDCHYLANALEDTILHADFSTEFSLDGISNFLENVGETLDTQKYTKLYEAHAKLNMYVWGNKEQKQKVSRFYTHDNNIKECLTNFLERSGLKEKNFHGKDRNAMRFFLNNEQDWPRIAKVYAEEFSKLMEPGYAIPLMNHSGAGTKGREDEECSDEGNVFDKEMERESFKSGRIMESHKKAEETPKWMDSFEAMDLLYQGLAKRMNIKAESYKKQTEMPICWYGSREFDVAKDNFRHTKFGISDKGKVELRKKRFHERIPLEVKVSQKGFPSSRFGIFDTSGSMRSDPEGGDNIGNTGIIPWGDNSRYHHGLVSWYSLIEYLKQNHLLNQTSIDLATFSNETRVGKGLKAAKKEALSPQWGYSYLDIDKVVSFFEGRENLIFTISDGEIDNWSEIKDDFIESAKKHYYFHLQIGGQNKLTRDMEEAGLHVEQVMNASDLSSRTIDLTDALLRGRK